MVSWISQIVHDAGDTCLDRGAYGQGISVVLKGQLRCLVELVVKDVNCAAEVTVLPCQ
jgi:hypothetical protein